MQQETSKLRVAVVGCGQIADAHLGEIRKTAAATAVAVCDQHRDLAEQASARFGVDGVYDSTEVMLREVRPDVVHITTPPHTHRPLAVQALNGGAHVYVEKPFALDAGEAWEVLEAARAAGRMVCVGHDQLFDPLWLDCRVRCGDGRIGRVAHVDSIQGYDLGGPFGRAFAGQPGHWLHRLPGGLFQNVMSHALYRITDLIPDAEPEVRAVWFGGDADGLPTELRVMLRGEHATANLTFTSAVRPVQRVTRIYGTAGGFEVDLDGGTIRAFRKLTAPGPFAKIQAPARHLAEAARTLGTNLLRFARSDIHYFAGMHGLLERFYAAIARGTEPPIAPAEILRVTRLMDRIFDGCQRHVHTGPPPAPRRPVGTGAVSLSV